MNEIRNAVISSTMLGWEDHGILTCWLTLDYGGSGQGFGGYALDEPIKEDGKFVCRRGTDYGMQFVEGIMKAVGAESWEKLKGMHCRVEAPAGLGAGPIKRIGHFLKDQWFSPEDFGKQFKDAA